MRQLERGYTAKDLGVPEWKVRHGPIHPCLCVTPYTNSRLCVEPTGEATEEEEEEQEELDGGLDPLADGLHPGVHRRRPGLLLPTREQAQVAQGQGAPQRLRVGASLWK